MDYINKILCGNDLEILPKLPAESINCVITSPPYWSLRDYGIEPVIWDGDKNCKHKWMESKTAGDIRFRGENSIIGSERNLNIYPIKHRPNETNPGKEGWYKDKGGLSKNPSQSSFCSLCGAWRGSLGLEPTFELYIKHLCDIFDEVKRVLRKDGICFVNIGDSYGGSGNASGHTEDTKNLGYKTLEMGATQGNQKSTGQYAKCLLDIPYRFSIEMTNRGWIKRNTIIWYKKNCMPSSADDRFTIDFEYLLFFTKNNKAIFWTNEKTLECVGKKPPGTKGIEGKDWEWRKVGAINESSPNQRVRDIEKGALQKATEEEIKNYGKAKWKKMSLWSGHDYWFEQQFEEQSLNTNPRYSKEVEAGLMPLPKAKQNSKELNRPGYKNWREGTPKSFLSQGRNKRCVWIIPIQPFPEAHFAVYPEGLIEIPIKAGCPEFVCRKCGKARVKIYKETGNLIGMGGYGSKTAEHIKVSLTSSLLTKKVKEKIEIGYTDCGCNAGWESGIVLDPFMGAGTSALVALKQRKRFIGIEIKQEYIDMAKRRIAEVQQRIF